MSNQEKVQAQSKVKVICQRCSNVVSLDRSLLFFDYALYKQLDKKCRTQEEISEKAYSRYLEFLKRTEKGKKGGGLYSTLISFSSSASSLPLSSPPQKPQRTPAQNQAARKSIATQKHFPTIFPKMNKFVSNPNRVRSKSVSNSMTPPANTPPPQTQRKRTLSNGSEPPNTNATNATTTTSKPSTTTSSSLSSLTLTAGPSASTSTRESISSPLSPLASTKPIQKSQRMTVKPQLPGSRRADETFSPTYSRRSSNSSASVNTSATSSQRTSAGDISPILPEDGRHPLVSSDKDRVSQRSRRLKSHRNVKIIMKNGTFVVAQPGSEQQVLSDTITSVLSSVGVGKGMADARNASATPEPKDTRASVLGSPLSGAAADALAQGSTADPSEGWPTAPASAAAGGGGSCGQAPLAALSLVHNAEDFKVDALFRGIESDTAARHPLCVTCARKEYLFLGKEISVYRDKIALYNAHLAEIDAGMTEAEVDLAYQACLAEEKALLERIDAVKRRRRLLMPRKAALAKGRKRLAEMEAKYWTMYGAHQSSLARTLNAVHSLTAQVPRARARMDALARTYALDDAFPIRPAGHFGTINGFRLGRFSNILVSWSEVNCACGYAALLLRSVARALGLEAVAKAIVPMGSTPKILLNVKGLAPLDLFYESKMFAAKRFDEALAALLALTRKTAEHCVAADPAFTATVPLPYKIENDTIGRTSVRLQMAKSDHIWTYALKNLLTDLKWLVLWLSAHTQV